jgi:hypothetical protein
MAKNEVRLQVEPVESRVVMAGSITVNLAATTLIVTGTTGNDSIGVEQLTKAQATTINNKFHIGAHAGDYLVVSKQSINGVGGLPVVALTKTTNAALVSGADRVVIAGISGNDNIGVGPIQAQSVTITGGTGNDTIAVNQAQIAGSLVIAGVGGNDTVTVSNSKIGGNAVVTGGVGTDKITATKDTVGGNLTVVTSIGNDKLSANGLTVQGNTVISLGGGNDTVALTGAKSKFLGSVFVANGGTGVNHFTGKANATISDPHPTIVNFA